MIGCAIGYALARPGRSVLVIERGALGGEASGAAAGVLAAGSGDDEGPRLALRRASLARFPALVARLREESGIDVRFESQGRTHECIVASGSESSMHHPLSEVGRRVAPRFESLHGSVPVPE